VWDGCVLRFVAAIQQVTFGQCQDHAGEPDGLLQLADQSQGIW
jgi:hypothetical protein